MGGKFNFTKLAVGSVKNPAKGFTLWNQPWQAHLSFVGFVGGRVLPHFIMKWEQPCKVDR
jgi:hypothetical protein